MQKICSTKMICIICIKIEIRLFQKKRIIKMEALNDYGVSNIEQICNVISQLLHYRITVLSYSSRFLLYHESMVGVTAGVFGTLHTKPHECFSSHVGIQTGPKDVCCNSTGSCLGLTF